MDKNIILNELNMTQGMVIIDAGCGNGYMAKEFAKLTGSSGKVYALDIYAESIEKLKVETENTNITAQLADITKPLDIAENSADLIYLSTVFHGFDKGQIAGFNRQAKLLLKDGGVLAVVEINNSAPFGPPQDIRYSPAKLKTIIDLRPVGCLDINEFFYMQSFIK